MTPRPEMTQHEVFPTRLYTAVLSELADERPRLMADILRQVTADGGRHVRTPQPLQDETGAHWRHYYEVLGSFVDNIASTLHPRWTTRSFNSWALVFRDLNDWPSNFMSLHAHAQATFSTVCYLQVPEEFAGAAWGGTLVRNPLANIHHRYYDVDYVRFDATPMGLTVFPGFLEHLPERPPDGTVWAQPRIIVATDYCYY